LVVGEGGSLLVFGGVEDGKTNAEIAAELAAASVDPVVGIVGSAGGHPGCRWAMIVSR